MATRESIISSMCYTFRHDYGLDKYTDEGNIVSSGITVEQRKAIWNQMAQLFDNCVTPSMEFKRDLKYEAEVAEYFKNQHQYSE
jgi:hypothetical protein